VNDVMAAVRLSSDADQPFFDTLALEVLHHFGKYDPECNPSGLLPSTYAALNRRITVVVDYRVPVTTALEALNFPQVESGPAEPWPRVTVTDLPLLKDQALDAVLPVVMPPTPAKALETGSMPLVTMDNMASIAEELAEDALMDTEEEFNLEAAQQEREEELGRILKEQKFAVQDRVETVDPQGQPDEDEEDGDYWDDIDDDFEYPQKKED
jgi:hypothetical protein